MTRIFYYIFFFDKRENQGVSLIILVLLIQAGVWKIEFSKIYCSLCKSMNCNIYLSLNKRNPRVLVLCKNVFTLKNNCSKVCSILCWEQLIDSIHNDFSIHLKQNLGHTTIHHPLQSFKHVFSITVKYFN